MKETIEINMDLVRKLGANAAVALAIVEKIGEKVSNSQVQREMGVSFPTAQKTLELLHLNGAIRKDGKLYCKI